MSLDDFFGDPASLHEDCIPADDALSHVIENYWDDVEEAVADAHGQEWLTKSDPCLRLLSVVSQRDREHMRAAMRKRLRKEGTDGEGPTEDQLFAIAADVSAFIEQLPLPLVIPGVGPDGDLGVSGPPTTAQYMALSARTCDIDDDLSWSKDLLVISRTFRDLLSAISEANHPRPSLRLHLREPIRVLNGYRCKAPVDLLVFWQDKAEKQLKFSRCPTPKAPDLSFFIANWISDYLENHFSHISLGACVECGKFFARERRDKTFCSKTCQNRVAYKRKKFLESKALAPVNISPDDACDMPVGLWVHHPRYGIGLVESITNGGTGMASLLASVPPKPEDAIRYRSMLSRKITVLIRFLHGGRTFGYADLFEGQKKEDQLPSFYELKSEEALAELL